MEHAADFPLPKIFQKPCTYFDIVNFYVVHMCIMRTFFWNIRLLDLSFFGKELQIFIVKIINLHSLVTDLLMLSIKIRRIQLTWKIGGTVIHPPVFIYLSAEKLAAVRSLFSEDLRLLLVLVLIKQDRAAFSHSIVLRLMEAVAAKIPDSSKRFSFIVGIHTLSRIFHNFQIMASGDVHDRIHLACYTCIMNRNDCFCFFCDRLFDQFFIDIHGIRPNIHKYDLRSPQHKCICR